MVLTIGLYMTVLVAAIQITGAGAAAPATGDAVAAMGAATPAAPVSKTRSLGDATESPLMTLAIAGAAIASAGAYRLASVARRPRPAPIPVRGRRVSIPT